MNSGDTISRPHPRDLDLARQSRDRVRKRAPNACKRCRQQKIKCTGSQPCAPCQKRSLACTFDEKQQKILVARRRLSDLERQAAQAAHNESASRDQHQSTPIRRVFVAKMDSATTTAASHLGIDEQSESDHDESGPVSIHEDHDVTNPLVSGVAAYYSPDTSGQSYWLGTSSNWAFGRRVLTLLHSKAFGDAPLPHALLNFDGSTYELGWDGRRTAADTEKQVALPTIDYALFIINAVKFHCAQLFHLFDEQVFMSHFKNFYESDDGPANCSDLWYVHFLLVLALGKALLGRTWNEKRCPGADLFVQGMKLLPDWIYLWREPVQAAEVLCCVALYLQCLDMRILAYNFIGQAMRIAITNGWHFDVESHHLSEEALQRRSETWWTVYTLECHMSALQGVRMTLDEQDIGAKLPTLGGSAQKVLALNLHVKLAKITAFIQSTVYSRADSSGSHFLKCMRSALKRLADINDERTSGFPLEIDNPSTSVSRLSAHLHLFHHQAIVLATKPLLFGLFQRRLEVSAPIRIRSSGSMRALVRVCVGSARQIMKILAALQAQTLLESFIPFDLESVWCAALVLLIAGFVDPSLFQDDDSSLRTAHLVLDDMALQGNQIAACRKAELKHIDMAMRKLETIVPLDRADASALDRPDGEQATWDAVTQAGSVLSRSTFTPLQSWTFEDALNGQQLETVADALSLDGVDWLSDIAPFDQLANSFL